MVCPAVHRRSSTSSTSTSSSTSITTATTTTMRPRSLSVSSQDKPRVRIAYSDDALCDNAHANMLRLLHAAQQQHADSCSDNSVLLAKKALRYRNLLTQAQAVDVNGTSFEISDFLRVTWCKSDGRCS